MKCLLPVPPSEDAAAQAALSEVSRCDSHHSADGVLLRGSTERRILRKLLDHGHIDTVCKSVVMPDPVHRVLTVLRATG